MLPCAREGQVVEEEAEDDPGRGRADGYNNLRPTISACPNSMRLGIEAASFSFCDAIVMRR